MSTLERIIYEPALFFNEQISKALEHELKEIITHKRPVTVSYRQLAPALLYILAKSKNKKKVNTYAYTMLKELVERLAREEATDDSE